MATIKSIEEKAKAYDEALVQAKKELNTCGSIDCDAARQIFRFFPELKESEEEKIRKVIIGLLKQSTYEDCDYDGVNMKDIYAWLEKQGEQKSEEVNNLHNYLYDEQKPADEVGNYDHKKVLQTIINEQKPTEDEDREYACQSPEHYTQRELMIYNLGIADGKRMVENAINESKRIDDWGLGKIL